MQFRDAFLKFIDYCYSYLSDWDNFNGNKWGSFKSSYSSQYDVLKTIVGSEIMFDDLIQHLAHLISFFIDNILTKESNYHSNKDYEKLFKIVEFLSSENATFKRNKLSFCELFMFRNFKDKLLKPFQGNSSHSSQDTQANLVNDDNSVNSSQKNAQFYKYNNKLRSLFNDKVWLSFTVGLFGKHLTRGTTPPALFYNKFPAPYLPKNEKFVEKYNSIIESTQKQILELCVSTLSEKLEEIDHEISNIKKDLDVYFEKDELNIKFDVIEKKEECFLKPRMNKSIKKFNNIFVKKFEVKERTRSGSINSNISRKNYKDNSISNDHIEEVNQEVIIILALNLDKI
ncbi:unnamed protein product [Brachionus calyciflorus]|uniref:Uncharacterized protein n=1 Tax=Brachionus calyciflorus TaxID=104777 RepID=A0A814F9F4_9BILA|nr:unnamed protein product [Brachionus calyciflorus]